VQRGHPNKITSTNVDASSTSLILGYGSADAGCWCETSLCSVDNMSESLHAVHAPIQTQAKAVHRCVSYNQMHLLPQPVQRYADAETPASSTRKDDKRPKCNFSSLKKVYVHNIQIHLLAVPAAVSMSVSSPKTQAFSKEPMYQCACLAYMHQALPTTMPKRCTKPLA
jgi:hypothetical protein